MYFVLRDGKYIDVSGQSFRDFMAGKLPGLSEGFRFATIAEIESHFGCKPGYLGPIGLKGSERQPVKVVADRTVAAMSVLTSPSGAL